MDLFAFKDIFLVIFGAILTFVFGVLILKIQNKKPKITWRRLSAIKIPVNNLTGISWIIENQGSKSAKDVTILLRLSDETRFESINCNASEEALDYSCNVNDIGTELILKVPVFVGGVSFDISSLIKNLDNNISISIVGNDFVGKEYKPFGESQKIKTIFNKINILLFAVYTFSIFLMIGILFYITSSTIQYEQTKSIANLYIDKGDYREAIRIFEEFSNKSIMYSKSSSYYFNILSLYAKLGEKNKVISLMRLLLKKIDDSYSSKYVYYLETNSDFDKYRDDNEFKLELDKFREKSQ